MPVASPGSIQMQEDPVFIGLQSYTEAQSAMFFGRDEEIETLTTLVKVNTLTIVFGRSGTGKTSLLNAGVFPPLRKSYCLPFPIRLEFQDNSPDLVTQIKNVLKSKIDEYGFRVENYPGPATLWEYFHKEFLWKSITPILVFDQFEEIFTPKKNPNFANDKLENFWEELSDLIENKIPDLTDREKKVLSKHTKSIVNQLLKDPILQAKELAMDSKSTEKLELFQQIFGIDEDVVKEKELLAKQAKERLKVRAERHATAQPDLTF